jgi:hypothetical protein
MIKTHLVWVFIMVQQVDYRWNQVYRSLILMYEKLDKFGLRCSDEKIVTIEEL